MRPDDEAATFASDTKVRTSTISDVKAAVTVLTGADDEDAPSPARYGPAIVDALPNGRLQVHPEVGRHRSRNPTPSAMMTESIS